MYKEEFPQKNVVFSQAIFKLDNIIENLLHQTSSATSSSDLVPWYILSAISNVLEALMFNRTNKIVDDLNLPFEQMKDLTETVVNMIDKYFVNVFLETRITGEVPFTVDAGYFVTKGQRVLAENMPTMMSIEDTEARAVFPVGLLDGLGQDIEVFQTMTCMATNPFDWGYEESNLFVSSQILAVSFNYAENKTQVQISGLSENQLVQIWIPRINDSEADELDFDLSETFYVNLLRNQSQQTSLNISQSLMLGSAVHIEIGAVVPEEEDFSIVAYLGYGYQPFWYRYDDALSITRDSVTSSNHKNYTFFIYNR